MLKLLSSTMDIVFGQNGKSDEKLFGITADWVVFCQSLESNPRITCTTEHPEIKTKCEDSSKPILALFSLMDKSPLPQEKVKEIL